MHPLWPLHNTHTSRTEVTKCEEGCTYTRAYLRTSILCISTRHSHKKPKSCGGDGGHHVVVVPSRSTLLFNYRDRLSCTTFRVSHTDTKSHPYGALHRAYTASKILVEGPEARGRRLNNIKWDLWTFRRGSVGLNGSAPLVCQPGTRAV